MLIEDKIFNNHIIDINKLKKYGFKSQNGEFLFEANLPIDNFKTIIKFNGKFIGKIFDLSTGDEYTNFRIDLSSGFSFEIKEEFIKILIDIRDKCTEKRLFQTQQAQNINKYIIEKYKDEPEFLWKNFPTFAVFRNKINKKWYALFGTVQLNKVNPNSTSSEIVEILNVKVDKNEIEKILNQKGIYKAYHMNKKNWISIIFDNTLKDIEIQNFIDKSYQNI